MTGQGVCGKQTPCNTMNKLLRAILIIHPFTQYIFFRLEPLIARVLTLTGVVAILIIYLYSLKEEKRKVTIPWLWPYILVQSIFLGLPNYCIHISIFFLLYTTIAQMKIDWKYILYPLGYVCIVMSLLSILQEFGINQFKYNWSDNPGLLGNSTDTAMYIAAISPFVLLLKRGWLYFIIPMIAIWILNSASAVLGIFSVIAGYFIIKKYYCRLGLFLALSMVAICLWFDKIKIFFSPETKLVIWAQAMTDWKNFAWYGRGLGNFEGRYVINNIAYHMQNHYLYILYTLGLIGLVLLFLWLIPHLKNTSAMLPYLSVISVMIMAICSVPLRVYPIVLLVGIELGILANTKTT